MQQNIACLFPNYADATIAVLALLWTSLKDIPEVNQEEREEEENKKVSSSS
jgi:hypothetical protein